MVHHWLAIDEYLELFLDLQLSDAAIIIPYYYAALHLIQCRVVNLFKFMGSCNRKTARMKGTIAAQYLSIQIGEYLIRYRTMYKYLTT